MNVLPLIILIVFASCSSALAPVKEKKLRKCHVTGQALISGSYCGGAAISDKMMLEYSMPHPYAGLRLLIRKGDENEPGTKPLMELVTNFTGTYHADLPPGKYCLAIAEKEIPADSIPTDIYRELDRDCYLDWQKKCDLTFEVTSDTVFLPEIHLSTKCFVKGHSPCIGYSGPMPP